VTLLAAQSSQLSSTADHCAKVPLLVAQLKQLSLMTVHCAMATLLAAYSQLATRLAAHGVVVFNLNASVSSHAYGCYFFGRD
jgi:hypothetical protein